MRITYYRFPDGTPESVLLEHGCGVVLKDGREIYPESIPEERRPLVDHIDMVIGCSVSAAKRFMRAFGGTGWTEHCERDGGCFEVTEIKLSGNNSRFKYNHHL
ncbi:MAG: hypothetical protein J6M06_02700 [Synergistaceae bacterium]|nr:hypothetical protein [Synergistaceae bacterium]